MAEITIRQGETLEITITADDDTADTVQLLVQDPADDSIIINETESFTTVDGVTSAVIRTDDTNHTAGDYQYMLTITYTDGFIEKLPDANCDEECTLPTLRICEAITVGVS